MNLFFRSRANSFACATKGLVFFFRTQVNARIHLLASIMVLVAGFLFRINVVEWCILIICIAGVISLEIVNTAIEKLADKISGQYDRDIGHIKDLAAAAVFIVAIASAIIALLIFIPYLAR